MSPIAPVSRVIGRSYRAQFAIVLVSVVLVVGGLIFGLPTMQSDASGPRPYDPTAPSATATPLPSEVTVDTPYVFQFSKPMNQASVAKSLGIDPIAPVRLVWDSAGETLAVTPSPHWTPFTQYSIQIRDSALDQSGMRLDGAVSASFKTGALTSGKIAAGTMLGSLVAPGSTFTLTFTHPVKLATVQARWTISPTLTGTITGDDPTDVSSQVFTLTPSTGLASGTAYTLSFDTTNATDAAAATLLPIDPLVVTTIGSPQVVRFQPPDNGSTSDPNQIISVRFSVQMDRASTARAVGVSVNGVRIKGTVTWSEGDTVLAFDPASPLPRGSTVRVVVVSTAKSVVGQHIGGTADASFTVRVPTTSTGRHIVWNPGAGQSSSPYASAENFYFALMNCTRTGGWVVAGGSCTSSGHHTLPAQAALRWNGAIANISRAYSEALAIRNVLTHTLGGSTPHSRLSRGGFTSQTWGENIASPTSVGTAGMAAVEIYYQNESSCRTSCVHYKNIMYSRFHQAGVGVWVASGHIRITIDFYA
jgi:hypothetical protein